MRAKLSLRETRRGLATQSIWIENANRRQSLLALSYVDETKTKSVCCCECRAYVSKALIHLAEIEESMTDLVTIGMGSAVTAYLLKDGVSKLLGPTCDYLGKETATWVEKRHHNIRRIFEVAIRRLGSKIDEEGTISPRILRDVINDGSWMDDSLSTEYFGGMLASARSSEGGEDIAFNFIQTLKNLSALQIRFHYVLYRAGQFALENRTEHVNDDDLLRNIIFIPFSDLMSSLNLPKSVDLTHFFG